MESQNKYLAKTSYFLFKTSCDNLLNQINCNKNQHGELNQQEKMVLNKITHVMDCECFVLDRRIFYREITVYDLNNRIVKTFHLYDFSFPNFSELNLKQKKNNIISINITWDVL